MTPNPTSAAEPEGVLASPVTTVAVCDDHAVVREGVSRIIESVAGFSVEARAGTARELLAALDQTRIDVCVLDLTLPDRNGVELIPEIGRLHPDTKVLVLTNHSASSVGMVCMEAGARGFLGKGAAPSELVDALCAVRRGDVSLPPELVNALVRKDPTTAPHVRLSPREWEVFVRLARGSRVSDVAAELDLDQRTVTAYRRRVLDKLAVETNAGLVAYAILHGLIDADEVMHHER